MNTLGSIIFLFSIIQLSWGFDVGKCAIAKIDANDCAGIKSVCGKECKASCDTDGDDSAQSIMNCKDACDKATEKLTQCCDEGIEGKCCKLPNQEGPAHIDCSVIRGNLNGANQGHIAPGKDCPKMCEDEDGCECGRNDNVQTKKRRKRASDKDDDPLFLKFNPLFIWHQDDIGSKLVTSKKRKCCITTKRVVPFTWKIKKHIWPVFCPIDGGYQWIDQVICNVQTKQDLRKYQVFGISNPKNCGGGKKKGKKPRKKCLKECTMRTYLVTNVKPQGFWGHCFYYFLPVWYRNVNVDTHCICPNTVGQVAKCK